MENIRVFYLVIVYSTLMILIISSTSGELSATQHFSVFCQNEIFEGDCRNEAANKFSSPVSQNLPTNQNPYRSHVIVMTSAHYGMMTLGRCVINDYGYIGCGADVLHITDKVCSGRRTCSLRIPNTDLDNAAAKICPPDFKYYLNVSYQCIETVHASRPGCSRERRLTAPQGVISSVTTMETGCGSQQLPWVIDLQPGQRISLTLHDFSSHTTQPALHDITCRHAYATVKESGRSSFTICDSGARVVPNIYESRSETIQIFIPHRLNASNSPLDNNRHFLIEYKAVGCSTPMTPLGGWLARQGEQLTGGCNKTSDVWNMKCAGYQWVGDTPTNCSYPETAQSLTSSHFGGSLALEIVAIAIVTVAVLTAIVFLIVGVVCIRRRSNRTSTESSQRFLPQNLTQAHRTNPGGPLNAPGYPYPYEMRRDPDYNSDIYKDSSDYAYIDSNPTTGEVQLYTSVDPPKTYHQTKPAETGQVYEKRQQWFPMQQQQQQLLQQQLQQQHQAQQLSQQTLAQKQLAQQKYLQYSQQRPFCQQSDSQFSQ